MPRETLKQRAACKQKQVQAKMHAREQAMELARALEQRQDIPHDITTGMQTVCGRSRLVVGDSCDHRWLGHSRSDLLTSLSERLSE